jgi:protein-S-isoprenylcysteine O-methyltransferase Ste14
MMFAIILVAAFGMSGFFRRRARQSGAIPRRREGARTMFLRLLFALPFYLGMVAYVVNPRWMDWSALPLSATFRWVGVVVGLGTLPLLYWVLSSLGRNISETFLTKGDHQLVTHGPYRWVRHPLYSVATIAFLALGLVAGNAFILVMAAVVFAALALLVVPKEEAQLVEKFGGAYRAYQGRTGGLLPRIPAEG